jgi:hypothetical protein
VPVCEATRNVHGRARTAASIRRDLCKLNFWHPWTQQDWFGAQTVLAKAALDWNDPACLLRAGSVISGHIADLEQKQNKGSSVSILFDHADCDGRLTPIGFTLYALIATPKVDEGRPMVGSAVYLGSMHGSIEIQRFDLSVDTTPRNRASATKTPSLVAAGQVVGLNKVTLSVGSGPEGSDVLTTFKGNIRLEGETQLVLMPKAADTPDEASTLTSKAEEPTTANPPANAGSHQSAIQP